MARHLESGIQQAIVSHLRSKGYFPVAVPNGTKLAGTARQRAMRMAFLKKEGLVPGWPDLLVYHTEGRVGHLEIKAPKGRQQANQAVCQQVLEEYGHRYAVCRSIEDVDAVLVSWGWDLPAA